MIPFLAKTQKCAPWLCAPFAEDCSPRSEDFPAARSPSPLSGFREKRNDFLPAKPQGWVSAICERQFAKPSLRLRKIGAQSFAEGERDAVLRGQRYW